MEEAAFLIHQASWEGRSDEGAAARRSAAHSDLLELGMEREQLSQSQIDVLRGILSSEQVEALPDWDFDRNPRLRPWDQSGERGRHPKEVCRTATQFLAGLVVAWLLSA